MVRASIGSLWHDTANNERKGQAAQITQSEMTFLIARTGLRCMH